MNNGSKTFRWIVSAAVAAGLCAGPALGQGETSSADAFNIPDNITVLGEGDPNVRRASAVVNGQIITRTDVDQRVALILDANDAVPTAEEMQRLRLQVFRNLIDETLQIEEAAALERPVEQAEIEETYVRVAANQNLTKEAMDQRLREIGSSPASLKRQIEGELAWDWLIRNIVAPFVNVSDSEVTELQQRLEASRGTDEYRLGEIFLSANSATQQAVMQNAQRIVEQLQQGGSFVAYARQFSEASTAAVGGDLGFIRLEQLQNPTLEQIVAEMQPGQLVGPVEIPGGIWIGYLVDKRQIGMPDQRNAIFSLKQIAIEYPEGISEEEFSARTNSFAQAVQQIRGCGDAESGAAALGAQVVANDIPLGELPEQIQAWLLPLNVGQVTPVYGDANGVRVLMLCGRDEPEAVVAPTADVIMGQIREDRVNKRAQRYLRDLRRDAVIEYK